MDDFVARARFLGYDIRSRSPLLSSVDRIMEHSQLTTDQSSLNESSPRKRRGVVKIGLIALVLAGAAGVVALKWIKPDGPSASAVEYEKLDEDKAAAKERDAEERVAKNQEALKQAQREFQTALADWESAKSAKSQAEKTKQSSAEAESRFREATARLEEAKTRLKAAEDKLKTADELRAEAEAERRRIEELIAQEEAHRKALLGKWTRASSIYGQYRLELNDDGSGAMIVDFNTVTRFAVGASRLEVDIRWKVVNGNHVIFDSIAGRPENAFKVVSEVKGNHRDEVIAKIDENSFTTHHPDDKSTAKTWTRIPSE